MIRRTVLKLAAAAMIHPAFNWIQPDRVVIWDFWVPTERDTFTVYMDVSYNFLCHKRGKLDQIGGLE